MDHDAIWMLIPLLAIGGGIVKSILASQEKRLEMRLRAQQGQNEEVQQQIAGLHAEVAALRDTSTEFDVSLDTSVQRLEERVGRLETKTAVGAARPPETYLHNSRQ